MILLHRITPFAIALLSALGFTALILEPFTWGVFAIAAFVTLLALFARLLMWDVRRTGFWVFLGMAMFFLVSSLAFLLLLEAEIGKWILGVVVSCALGLFAENLFAFYHLPRAYQAYSLEYLSLMIAIGGLFFFTNATYLAQTFLEVPLWASALVIPFVVFAVCVAVFWVSKVSWEAGRTYAFWGAVVLTECYVALSWLPTGFTTNGAVFAICTAWYLGVMRAHALEKMHRALFLRHSAFALALIGLMFITTPWR